MKFNNKVISRDEIEIILSSTSTASTNYVIDADIIELKAENLPSKTNLKRFGIFNNISSFWSSQNLCKTNRQQRKLLSVKTKLLMQQLKEFGVENQILIRKTLEYKQIVFSENYHQIVFRKIHEDMGYRDSEKVSDLESKGFIGHIWQKISSFMWQ